VGFNPFRSQRTRTGDILIVVIAAIVIALIIAWAAIPR
jgi:hypothetical protein